MTHLRDDHRKHGREMGWEIAGEEHSIKQVTAAGTGAKCCWAFRNRVVPTREMSYLRGEEVGYLSTCSLPSLVEGSFLGGLNLAP